MLPRRCKHCRCYVAPQLTRCPRCGKVSPSNVVVKPTKEEKLAARKKQDAKVPILRAKHMHWIPSVFSLKAHRSKLEELNRLLERADSARGRNAIRSEIRITKAHLARKAVPSGKKAWTTESLYVKHSYVTVYISPKKHRYVLADRDTPADLLIEPTKKNASLGMIRLQRLEKSGHMRTIRKHEQEEAQHSKRKKVKKEHRAKKRLLKRKAE
jgi:hypothetical protein